MNDKQQLAAMGEHLAEQAAQPLCMAKRIEELVGRAERAERALTRSGFTYTEGAQEWKPPLGPSASPLLGRIDLLTFLLRELRDGVEGEWCFPGNLDERIDAALAGKLPEPALPQLSHEEHAALVRFNLCCEDGQGYDVDKDMMIKLARKGALYHRSAGYYELTEAGSAMLAAAPSPDSAE